MITFQNIKSNFQGFYFTVFKVDEPIVKKAQQILD